MAGRAGKARRTTCPWPPADRSCAARSSSEAADIDPLDLASDAVRRADAHRAAAPGAHPNTLTPPAALLLGGRPAGAAERRAAGLRVWAARAHAGAGLPSAPRL